MNAKNDKFLFKGEVLPEKLLVEKVCKIMIKDSDEFITIKITESNETAQPQASENNIKPEVIHKKEEIENARIKIIKEISETHKLKELEMQ